MATNGVMSGARTEYEMPKIRTNKWSVYWNRRVKKMLPWPLKLKLGSIQMLSVPSRAGNSHDYRKVYHRFQKAPFSKCFSSIQKHKAPFTWQTRVDDDSSMAEPISYIFIFFSGVLLTPLNKHTKAENEPTGQLSAWHSPHDRTTRKVVSRLPGLLWACNKTTSVW